MRPCLLILLFCACSRETPAPAKPAPAPAPARAEDEVLASLRAEPCGSGTVADLCLPEPYLRRVADRVLRSSYVERFRVIVSDGKPAEPAPVLPEGSAPPIVQHVHESPALSFAEGPPERAGFRARAERAATAVDTTLVPREFVRQRLARDGLLATAVAVIAELRQRGKRADAMALESAGLPLDWLSFFGAPNRGASPDAHDLLEWLATGPRAEELANAAFAFRPSAPGFKVASESGEEALAGLRVQLTRGDDWDRPGDGGSVDLVRQLVEGLPALPIVASLESKQLPAFLRSAGRWHWGEHPRFDLLLEPGPLAQWAQDNAKTGRDDSGALVLVPRYASRGELGASFIPGETFAPDGLALVGQRVVASPLLFQGGNLYCCTNPKSGERLLLMGEAELHRNTSLGLSQAQVLSAFRAEFGVDRCVVLPAVSFHIDVELSVRAVGGELVAFVDDQASAAQMIVGCGLDALAAHGDLKPADQERIRNLLEQKHLSEAFAILTPILEHDSNTPGQFSESVARAFCAGPGDSGPGNMLRFLAAIDCLSGLSGAGEQPGLDPHSAAYLRSFLRRERERYTFVHGLESLGMRIVPLPGWPEDTLGITPLNGIHEPKRYLLPTYGGLYRPLDDACAEILARTLGSGVELVRIGCAESQRRAGALRCSVSPSWGR